MQKNNIELTKYQFVQKFIQCILYLLFFYTFQFNLSQNDGYESDMALAMNRYIGNSILPLLIKHSKFYNEADNYASLLDATLHTVYRLSKNRMLTKGQREAVSDFLVALTR